ncbi:MAG: BTAD domain-containing putative transcriptional regulator, partial [Actinobacteria bacterium]|nr:BTAD domain-containing putative transcriptional regulator [Actinomycetota bacterium]
MSRRFETSVEFNALGPVTVTDGADSLNIGGPKQRTVLAMLIAHAGRPVSNDLIAQAVYGEDRPERGRRTVQTYVSTLRSIVGDVVVKDGRGWSLRVDRDQIDTLRFEDLYESVRDADNLEPESIATVLRDALSLWRGHPYDDIEAHGLLEAEVTRLDELRVAVQAARIDADLAAGRDADLIGEIEALLFEYPYQERIRAQHMTALYRAGRQKEALRSYGQIRSLLLEELGVDPNQELQSLEQRILEQDSSLDVAPRRSIQKRAILVADPGDPLELARMPPAERQAVLNASTALLRSAVRESSGDDLVPAGTASYAVFDNLEQAVSAAETTALRADGVGMRLAIDYGDVEASVEAVSGPPVSRAAVLVAIAHQGQVLLSADAQHALIEDGGGAGLRFESLGSFDLVGIENRVPVYQLLVGDPPAKFPPLVVDRTPPPLPGGGDRSVPGYELREPVGEGSIGTLYRAYQPSVGREVMIEVIGRSDASDPDFIRNFEADAQRLALLDHPNINPLLDYWRDPEGAFLVYRYHRGGFLSEQSEMVAGRLIDQVGTALAYAHSYGVVHGSVRPDRIALDESGNAFVTGFPIAGVNPTSNSTYLAYIAPENLGGEAAAITTDVFALGVLAHQLSTDVVTADSPIHSDIPAIARAVDHDPSRRHQSVTEFLIDLNPGGVESPESRFTDSRNPYKGLAAFQESDAGDFYGRGQVIEELLGSLTDDRFLAVVGPSGIGK